MKDKRVSVRVKSSDRCELDLGGSSYKCRLDNISSSSAAVKCVGFLQESWPGDKGVLHLNDHGGEVACHITRIASSKISLRFENDESCPKGQN